MRPASVRKQSCLLSSIVALFASTLLPAVLVYGQSPATNWDATQFFRFQIEQVTVTPDSTGVRKVTVLFSVVNPADGGAYWNIKADEPFVQASSLSRVGVIIGWSTTDYTNTGAANESLTSMPFGKGTLAAGPITIDALRASTTTDSQKFQVVGTLPKQAAGTGVVAIDGRLAWPDGSGTYGRVPFQNVYKYFAITDSAPVARREVVDIQKCKACHDGELHKGHEIPRLSLHGNNRTEELHVCAICHNPNQTDIPYRTSGAEVAVDFKSMIHGIHGNKRRETPLKIVGFGGTLYDFGSVVFPTNVRDCARCHIDENGKGTFELPLASSVLGTTVDTKSVPGSTIDVNPANDVKVTPTAAVCSSCHDSSTARSHMVSRGASFSTTQAAIDAGTVVEQCANCHAPGKEKSVRKVHR